jgi:hypothetical protein
VDIREPNLVKDQPAKADRNWAHTLPVAPAAASQSRLDESSETVSLKNNSVNQTHILYDRHMQPIELRPGETRVAVEMTKNDIEYFVRERTPGRWYRNARGEQVAKPLHPIEVIGISDPDAPRKQADVGRKHADAPILDMTKK